MPESRQLSADQLLQIDNICNAFESAFASGSDPQLEDYLDPAAAEVRPALFNELLPLELHYRPDCCFTDLARRFPDLDPATFARFIDQDHQLQPGEYPAIPGYFIMEELGRGGMGVVYRAADLTLHRQVALKMVHHSAEISAEHRRRFIGEARAAARLHHANLVQIFDSGEFQGQPFLVFELVEGGTLAEHLQHNQLTFDESADLTATLSEALQYAHDCHIIHRDLKPSNILMGKGGIPQINDFGLAKRLDDDTHQTLSGTVVGTPSYMAPEQASGSTEANSPAVDVYALGAILYELLTGQPPFKAASVMETLEQLRTKEPVAPRTLRPAIPQDLETICLKCLQKEPNRRYASAQLVAEELRRFCQGESIIARPMGIVERSGRWCRRYPLSASLVGLLTVVIVTAFIAVTWQWREAVAQRSQAKLNAWKFRVERDRAIEATDRASRQAAETEAARAESEKLRRVSDGRYVKAQEAVRELIRLGSALVRQPQMETAGRQALEKASEFGQSLLTEKHTDPIVLASTAETLNTLAWTYVELGLFPEAETTYQKTLLLLDQYQQQEPNSTWCTCRLRDVSGGYTIALARQSKNEAAQRHSLAAVEYAEKVVEALPDSPAAKDRLANALVNWAGRINDQERRPQAVEARERAVVIYREINAADDHGGRYRMNFALALQSLAQDMWTSDRSLARSMLSEAIQIQRQTTEKKKTPRNSAMYLIRSLIQHSKWLIAEKQFEEARRALEEAMEYGSKTRNAFPAYFGARLDYVKAIRASRQLATRLNEQQQIDQFHALLHAELASLTSSFPDNTELARLAAWYDHEWGLVLQTRKQPDEGMTLIADAFDTLCELQNNSSSPKNFHLDIKIVADRILHYGGYCDYAPQKLIAVQRIIDQAPDNSIYLEEFAWRLLCVTDLTTRDPDTAEKLVRQAIQINSERPSAHFILGAALYYGGRYPEAATAIQESMDRNFPAAGMNWYVLAMIRFQQGNQSEATRLLKSAVDWHKANMPDNQELDVLRRDATQLIQANPADDTQSQ